MKDSTFDIDELSLFILKKMIKIEKKFQRLKQIKKRYFLKI